MKSSKNEAPITSADDTQVAAIETVALDDVTGGCAACGQNCAAGPAPAADGSKLQNAFAAFSAFARR